MAGSKNSPARKYGKAVGAAFHARLADVWAARNVAELPFWLQVPNRYDRFLLPLADGFALLFESNHDADRTAKTVDWEKVTRVQLLEVKVDG